MAIFEFNSISLVKYAKIGMAPHNIQLQGFNFTSNIKKGRTDILTPFIVGAYDFLKEHITNDSVLVPVPRSAPLIKDAVWPSLAISNKLLSSGLGSRIEQILVRTRALSPSHLANGADNRSSIEDHYNTISCSKIIGFENVKKIVLVDDVITQGRTAIACYKRIKELYPEIEIIIFTPVIRINFQQVNSLESNSINVVQYTNNQKAMVITN